MQVLFTQSNSNSHSWMVDYRCYPPTRLSCSNDLPSFAVTVEDDLVSWEASPQGHEDLVAADGGGHGDPCLPKSLHHPGVVVGLQRVGQYPTRTLKEREKRLGHPSHALKGRERV